MQDTGPVYRAYESITATDTIGTLTAATYRTCEQAFITVEQAAVRYTLNGEDPDLGTDAHLVPLGGTIRLTSPSQIQLMRFNRVTGTNSLLKVSYGS